MGRSSYMHAIDGRIRVKVVSIKRNPTRAMEIHNHLRTYKGISSVKANPLTGNVLVEYDPAVLNPHEITTTLKSFGWCPVSVTPAANASLAGVRAELTRKVTTLALECALKGLMSALL